MFGGPAKTAEPIELSFGVGQGKHALDGVTLAPLDEYD